MAKQLLTLILLACGMIAVSQEVAQWRGPDRDGIYHQSGLLKEWPQGGPELLWHFDELGPGHASAAVTSDRIFTAGTIDGDGYVFAFDHDGNMLWKSRFGKEWMESWPGVRSTPLVLGNRLYMMSSYGKLFSMDADNGNIVWETNVLEKYDAPNIKWGVTENLAFHDNMLFCMPGGKEHNVLAVDMNSGDLIWNCKAKGEESAYCSPVVIDHNGRKILLTQSASSILGIDVKDGKMLWSFDWPNKYSVHANTPYYQDGKVYCMSGYGKGGVMLEMNEDGTGVSEVWQNAAIDNRMGGFIVMDGYIYGSADNGLKWYGLDWETGEEIFGENLIKKGTIIAADGMLYLYGEDGKIVLARPENGKINTVSTFDVPYGEDQHWAHPVIHGKKLYVRHGTSLMVYSIAAQ